MHTAFDYSHHQAFINLIEVAAFCRSGSIDCDVSELRYAFDLCDKDKNGLISETEIFQVLTTLRLKFSIGECHTMIKSVDSDGNVNCEEFKKMQAFINLTEFAAFFRSGSIDCDVSELRDAFDLCDKDKNGLISETEICQ
ncbi:hypothetical protein RYX36_001013, partial [Vicia faba]